MNEVSNIHLGRQAFTISAEAYRDLQRYLDAIEKQVDDQDVIAEVELRMAELLAEHGISGDKVVLPADISFLKEQLGDPQDFKEEAAPDAAPGDKPSDTKRLFRDTEHGMIAGVAAGLAVYTGIDVVFIRIVFIIGVFTGGWGILIYLVLWLLAPEAQTSSDRLRMAGKPVTVNSLREVVERADVKGAARRANDSLARPINTVFHFVLKAAGIFFILSGLSALFGLIGAETYLLLQSDKLQQDSIFPVGIREHLLVDIVIAALALISILVIVSGMALFRRKWPLRAWVTGLLIGLVFLGAAAGGALTADIAPQAHARYLANKHTVVRTVPAFDKVDSIGDNVSIDYRVAAQDSLGITYYGHPDLSAIKTTVSGGVLLIDSRGFNDSRNCQSICLPATYEAAVIVYTPNPPDFSDPAAPPKIPSISLPVPDKPYN